MGLAFYKPNPRNGGAACSWTFNSRARNSASEKDEKAVFLEVIAQKSWDDKNKTGSFDKEKKAFVKLTYQNEVGEILRVLNTESFTGNDDDKANFFHKNDAGSTQITFQRVQYESRGKTVNAFGLTVKKKTKDGENTWKVPFTLGEAEVLKQWLENALIHIFDGIYSEDKKLAKASREKMEL